MLVIKEAQPSDALAVINYLNIVGGESDNLLFGKNGFSMSVEEEKKILKSWNDDPNCIMLLGFIDDEIVSSALIRNVNRERIAHNGEVAISVLRAYWHQGIGSKMLQALIDFAHESPNLMQLRLGVRASNTNAIALYEKHGFLNVGRHRNYFLLNGQYDDEILMDLDLGKLR